MSTSRDTAPFLPPGESSEEITAKGPWQIEGPDSCDWALGKLAEARAQAEEIERQAEAARSVVESRRATILKRIGAEVAFFESAILTYATTHRGEIVSGRRKSRDYLHGRISFRSTPGRLVIEDADALAKWLDTRSIEEGLSRVKTEPIKAALDAYFARTNDLPPGCKYQNPTESITAEAIEVPSPKE